jgi:hypothetical protein
MSKPKAPGRGYRWLRSTETLRETDEYKVNDGWRPTSWPGQKADDCWTYRRKIKPKPHKVPRPPRLSTLWRRVEQIGLALRKNHIALVRLTRREATLGNKFNIAHEAHRVAKRNQEAQ